MRYLSILCLLLLLVPSACSFGSDDDSKSGSKSEDKKGEGKGGGKSKFSGFSAPTTVRVATVEEGAVATYQVSTGNIEAINLAAVHARVSEVVVEYYKDVGDRVEAGTVLARLFSDRFDAELEKTESAVERAKIQEAKAKADFDKKAEDYRLLTAGSEESKDTSEDGLFSKDEIREAKAAMTAAEFALNEAKEDVKNALANQKLAQLDVDACEFKSPIDGIVARRMVNNHQLVSNGDEVFTIARLEGMQLQIDIPESVEPKLRKASATQDAPPAVLLQTNAHPGKQFLGKVRVISPTIDPTKGMIAVIVDVMEAKDVFDAGVAVEGEKGAEFEFSEQAVKLMAQFPPPVRAGLERTLKEQKSNRYMLRPGMWVEASVVTESKPDTLVIPATAISSGMVFVVDEAKKDDAPTASAKGEEPKEASGGNAAKESESKSGSAAKKRGGKSGFRDMMKGSKTVSRIDISEFIGMQGEGFTEILPNKILRKGMQVVWRGQDYLKDGGKIIIEKERTRGQ